MSRESAWVIGSVPKLPMAKRKADRERRQHVDGMITQNEFNQKAFGQLFKKPKR